MGEMLEFQKKTHLPSHERKTILLLSDDFRMLSGIGTISKLIVRGLLQRYNIVQLGAAVKHPDEGKIFDISQAAEKDWGIDEPYLKVYSSSGYGNPDVIRQLISVEKADAVLHFTDPRFWIWLYHMEHELRQKVPLLFYHIWDDLPYPMYNRNFYESCDWIGCISKQTYNIVQNVWGSKREPSWKQYEDWQVDYVPHGISSEEYYPIDENHKEYDDYLDFTRKITSGIKKTPEDVDFVLSWANRNIRRKMPGDVILAYKTFCDGLTKKKAQKCMLVMHTAPIDDAGTDLFAVAKEMCPDYPIVFSNGKMGIHHMNYLFNMTDVMINIASAEGFGLGTCESLMANTPIIVNVTGGLQDQCGFRDDDGNLVWVDDHFNKEWGSNHDGKYQDHGEWVKPIWPATRSLVGSPPTPYIFDDRCQWEEVAVKIREWYDLTREERKEAGKKGREYCQTEYPEGGGLNIENMCMRFIKGIDTTFDKWEPRQRFELFKV